MSGLSVIVFSVSVGISSASFVSVSPVAAILSLCSTRSLSVLGIFIEGLH
jgi:hypothetical protein